MPTERSLSDPRTPLIRSSGPSIAGRDGDATQLLTPGHRPEMKRNHTKLSLLGLAFAILNSWTALSASLSIALPSGGPSAVLWGLLISCACNVCLAASLAEFLSAWPTAGGQYHWVAAISPPELVPLLSWICGWINCSGWVLLVATGGSLGSQMIAGAFSLLNPEFEQSPLQTLGIYALFTITAFLVNSFGNKLLPLFAKTALIWSVSGFSIISLTLLAYAAPDFQSPGFVFKKFVNETGWPDGVAWLLGLLQGALALTGYDAVAHMIEELPNPSIEGPPLMIYAVLIGFVTGFAFLTTLLFCVRDIKDVIEAAEGPLLAIFYQVTGSKGVSICLVVFPLVCLLFGTTTIMTTASRMLYAFARDNGLPYAAVFASIHPDLRVPLNALLLTTGSVLLLGNLFLLSATAFNAILSASVVFLGLSYAFPVLINISTGRRKLPEKRKFRLDGLVGWGCNILGLGFSMTCAVLFVLPPVLPVTMQNMNYSFMVFMCVLLASAVSYVFDGRGKFVGPLAGIECACG